MWKFMLILYVLSIVSGAIFAIYNNLVPQAIYSLFALVTLAVLCLILVVRYEIRQHDKQIKQTMQGQ